MGLSVEGEAGVSIGGDTEVAGVLQAEITKIIRTLMNNPRIMSETPFYFLALKRLIAGAMPVLCRGARCVRRKAAVFAGGCARRQCIGFQTSFGHGAPVCSAVAYS